MCPSSLTLRGQWTRTPGSARHASASLVERLETKDSRQENIKHAIGAAGVLTILIPAAISVLVATSEPLTEIVVIVSPLYVVATIAVIRILIGIRAAVIGLPTVLVVCLASPEAFLVTIVHCLAEKVRTVLICFVVMTSAIVTIDRGGIEIRILVVVGVAVVLEIDLLLTQTLHILLLETILRHPVLLLQLCCLLLHQPLLLV